MNTPRDSHENHIDNSRRETLKMLGFGSPVKIKSVKAIATARR